VRNEEPVLKEIASVTDVCRLLLHLSRSRFYQLLKEGVFPEPSRNPETGRPYYDREGQERCLEVRRRNCGVNGRPVLFYTHRPIQPLVTAGRQARRVASGRSKKCTQRQEAKEGDRVVNELRRGLAGLGMPDAKVAEIRSAISEAFPDGHRDVDQATLLTGVFRHLRSRDSRTNVVD